MVLCLTDLSRRELGYCLGSLGNSVLCKLSWKHKTNSGLDLAGRKSCLLVVGSKLSCLSSDATYTEATFALLGQFVKCTLDVWLHKKDNSDNGFVEANSKELGLNTISFMKQIRDVCDLDHDIIYEYIPQHLCEMLELVED